MNGIRIAAFVLIAVGVLALAYGGFSYTKSSDEATIGPVVLTVTDKERVNIPVWAGAGAIIVGVGMLIVPLLKS